MIKIIIFLVSMNSLMADGKDQEFEVGNWEFADDKKAHFFAGFACYSIADRITTIKPIKYSIVFLFAASKEIVDSWHASGTLSDVAYTMGGAVVCNLALKVLGLENKKKLKVGFIKNKVLLAWEL